jgi:16S rRNA (adenine(1408)-N(1))-methyltransferase
MQIVRGRKRESMPREALCALIARFTGVTLDVGTGDGSFVYRYAREHPERLVIGLDPVAENMREWSAKAARRPARGGLPNALYVLGSVEQPPDELRGGAEEVFVTLPWGSLMRGLVLGEDNVLAGLAALVATNGRVRIVINTRIFDEPVPLEARDLPEPTPVYVRQTLAPRYAAHDLEITAVREIDADAVRALGTTWAKRLSHRRPPPSIAIECTKRAPDG